LRLAKAPLLLPVATRDGTCQKMRTRLKNYTTTTLKFGIAAGLIYWLVSSGKINFSGLQSLLDPRWLPIYLIIVGLNIGLASERWRVLLEYQGIAARRWDTFKMANIGLFFNFVMPGGVGGDVVKSYFTVRSNADKKIAALNTVLMDRVLGLYTMILMAMASMLLDLEHVLHNPQLERIFWFLLLFFSTATIGLSVVFVQSRRVRNLATRVLSALPHGGRFVRLYESINEYGRSPLTVVHTLALSLAAQICAILFFIVLGSQMGFTEVSWKIYFYAAPLGFIVSALPISPGGVGVGQAAFLYLFNLYTGQESALGSTLITALQIMSFVYGLFGAFHFVRLKAHAKTAEAS
jgi:glycosyltransferase 2 family protein